MITDPTLNKKELNPEIGVSVDVQFTNMEKRNLAYFIAGLMCYKFAFESLGGSVNQFVLGRIPTVTTLSLLVIFYGLAQSFGSILVGQLVRVFKTSKIIAFFIGLFAALGLLYLLLEASTGGRIENGKYIKGTWNPYGIFPIYICMGGCLGVMELVRRVIPSYIVGTNPEKLKKMDATVHIFYEVSGTCGAFASAPMLKFLGPVYATFLIPPLFLAGAMLYWRIQHDGPVNADVPVEIDNLPKRNATDVLKSVRNGFVNYFANLYYGARIVFMNRHFVWLIFGYVLPLVIHRLVENLLFSLFSKNILKEPSLSQILLGGSNFGELCGAALVLKFSKHIKSPLLWVRIDAIALSVLWVLPYANAEHAVPLACGLIPVMMVLSGAWAAGDVSLLAFIQSNLPEEDEKDETTNKISPLGALMGFLYASYTIISTLLIYGLGQVFDHFIKQGDVRQGFFWIAGVGISISGVITFASTFIPKGSWTFNPDLVVKSVIPEIEMDGAAADDLKKDQRPPSKIESSSPLTLAPEDTPQITPSEPTPEPGGESSSSGDE